MLDFHFAHLFDADPPGTTPGSRQFVFDKFWSVQGPTWRPLFKNTYFYTVFHWFLIFFKVLRCNRGYLGVSWSPRGPHSPRNSTGSDRRAGGAFSTSPPPREPWLTVRRGQQVVILDEPVLIFVDIVHRSRFENIISVQFLDFDFWMLKHMEKKWKSLNFIENWCLLFQNDV